MTPGHRPTIQSFHEAVAKVPQGIGPNTRAIVMAILWAGERVARAVSDTGEARAVHEMSEEIGKAFMESVRPPPPAPEK